MLFGNLHVVGARIKYQFIDNGWVSIHWDEWFRVTTLLQVRLSVIICGFQNFCCIQYTYKLEISGYLYVTDYGLLTIDYEHFKLKKYTVSNMPRRSLFYFIFHFNFTKIYPFNSSLKIYQAAQDG